MVSYDPKIIQEFAEALYARARWIVLEWTMIGLVLGIPVGIGVGVAVDSGKRGMGLMLGFVLGPLMLAIVGYGIGSDKAYALRLQAQQTLCQMKIEENTRMTATQRNGV